VLQTSILSFGGRRFSRWTVRIGKSRGDATGTAADESQDGFNLRSEI